MNFFSFSVALDRIIHQVQKTGVPFRDAGRKPGVDQASGMGSFQTFSSRQNCARMTAICARVAALCGSR